MRLWCSSEPYVLGSESVNAIKTAVWPRWPAVCYKQGAGLAILQVLGNLPVITSFPDVR